MSTEILRVTLVHMSFSSLRNEPFLFLFKEMWKFAHGSRSEVVLFICLSVCANIVALVGPYIFGLILNEVQNSGVSAENFPRLALFLGLILGSTILFWTFHGSSRIIERRVAFRVYENHRNYLFSGVVHLPLGWHSNRDSGDIIDKVTKSSEGLWAYTANIFAFVQIIVRMIGTVAVLFLFNIYIALGVFLFTLFSLYILSRFDKVLVPGYQQEHSFDNRLHAKIFDALSNITSVIILGVKKSIIENIRKEVHAPHAIYMRNSILSEWKWFTGSIMFDLLLVVPIGLYLWASLEGNAYVQIGSVGALYLYLNRLSDTFFGFASEYDQLLIRKTRVQNAEPLERDFLSDAAYKHITPRWQKVSIQDVFFAYENAEKYVHLNGVSFSFARAERIALIGESGSGKTTLLKVLHGLYGEASGSITFDAKLPLKTNFADIDLRTMLVPQEPEVFSASIRENITLGLEYSDAEIMQAAHLASFATVLERLPKGLESVINEKGVNLSGGEKQRLALTRALLFAQGKDIILLDESTSSVDPTNESTIYKNIHDHFSTSTIIASIHKMNLLKYFDRIIIFESGKIIADGTFRELYASYPPFREHWDSYVTREGVTS